MSLKTIKREKTGDKPAARYGGKPKPKKKNKNQIK